MSLLVITAEAHPAGNRIDLTWVIDPATDVTGVRITRRLDSYPLHPDDGFVADVTESNDYADSGLSENQVYYYSLFPFRNDPPEFTLADKQKVARYTTAPNGYSQYLYDILPKIYQRYDETTFLKRFLQVVGGQLDQFHSFAQRPQAGSGHMAGQGIPL